MAYTFPSIIFLSRIRKGIVITGPKHVANAVGVHQSQISRWQTEPLMGFCSLMDSQIRKHKQLRITLIQGWLKSETF
ncbi:CII family transcriptional regulator [Photorhabdus khanii]|uniref:CII family transcriptional regulator n=1 Tax=Photorhabdus khanii TaxID=1004150 RepID=UPI0009DE975C